MLVADTGSAARSHFDTTAVEPGGVYRYRVAARRGSERSQPSATAWALIPQIEIAEPQRPAALPHRTEIVYKSQIRMRDNQNNVTLVNRNVDLSIDGNTLWVADHDDELVAFDLKTGFRKPGSDIDLAIPSGITEKRLRGVWVDERFVYAVYEDDKNLRIFSRGNEQQGTVGGVSIGFDPRAVWADGGLVYIGGDGGFQVWELTTYPELGGYSRRSTVDTGTEVRGIAADNETLWTLEYDSQAGQKWQTRARDLGTLQRQPEKDFFELNQANTFYGIAIHDDHIWYSWQGHGDSGRFVSSHSYRHIFNSSGEGKIRIRGDALVGSELTPDLSGLNGVSDPDGLGRLLAGEYEFRWARVEKEEEPPVTIGVNDGGHDRTYRPRSHDVGLPIVVYLRFVDGGGTVELIDDISVPTALVRAKRPDEDAVRPQLAAGGYHSCLVTYDGDIRCAGDNGHGQRNVPKPDDGKKYMSVSAGAFHTCGLQDDGVLKCWGNNDFGQIDVLDPGDGMVYMSVSAGPWHTCALAGTWPMTRDGLLKCWGDNTDSQLAAFISFSTDRYMLVSAGGFAGRRPSADGPRVSLDELGQQESRTCTLDSMGAVSCRGREMGDDGRYSAIKLTDDRLHYTTVSAGGGHACALVSNGTLDCWGKNGNGQLGPLGEDDSGQPTTNGSPKADEGWKWIEVAAGGWHTCATMQEIDGTDTRLRCWGNEVFFNYPEDSEDRDDPLDPYHGGHPTDANAGTNPHSPVAGTWHTCWFHGPDDDLKVSCRGDDDFPSTRWHNRRVRDYSDINLNVDDDGPNDITDISVDGNTLYVLDQAVFKVFAYNLLTGAREPSKDFSTSELGLLGLVAEPRGFAITPERYYVLYLSSLGASYVNHYDRGDPNVLVATTDVGRGRVEDLWTDGARLYMAADSKVRIRPLNPDTGTLAGGETSFGTQSAFRALAVDDEVIWTVEVEGGVSRIEAYDPETGQRLDERAFFPPSLNPSNTYQGLWVQDDRMWLANHTDTTIHVFRYRSKSDQSDQAALQVTQEGEEEVNQEGEGAEPLTAQFVHSDASGHHSGAGELLTLRLEFSEAVAITPEALGQALTVINAAVSTVSRVEGLGGVWEIGLAPASDAAVSVLLSPSGDCDAAGAVCTGDGRALAHGVAVTVPGPPPEAPDTGAAVVAEAPLFYSEEVTAQGIELSWNPDSGSTETGYVLYRRVLPRGELSPYAAVPRSGDVTSYLDTGVEAGLEYLYRVAGVNSAGEGPLSAPVRLVVPAERLEAPPGLAAEYTGEGIELSWGAPTNAATTGYVIYRGEFRGDGGPSDGRVSKHAEIAAGDDPATYLDTGVDEGAKYRYRVAAVNAVGEGKKSNWLDIEAAGPPP